MAAHKTESEVGAESERRLVARDRTELDAIADRLRGGRRVVAFVVCGPDLCPAARAYITKQSSHEVPAPEHVTDAERMLTLLHSTTGSPPDRVLSVRLDGGAGPPLEVLNQHRDKLRLGASVLLWLDDEAALRMVRQLAPDAFHFRDVVVGVVGEPAEPVKPPEPGDLELQLARTRHSAAAGPVERAWEAAILAGLLDQRGRNDEALAVVEEALWAVSRIEDDPEARLARARLHGVHAEAQVHVRSVDARHHVRAGLAALGPDSSPETDEERVWLWITARSPLGVEASVAHELAKLTREGSVGQLALLLSAIRSSEVLARKGDLRGAAALLEEDSALSHLSTHNRSALLAARGRVAMETGNLTLARALFEEAATFTSPEQRGGPKHRADLAVCLHLQGELAEARSRVGPRTGEMFEMLLDEGNVAAALLGVESLIQQAASAHQDRPLYDLCRTYTSTLARAHDAERLSLADLARADATLSAAEATALAIADDSVPWYRVLFAGMRAEVLALRPEHLDQASALLGSAFRVASAEWHDAAPAHARALAHVLIHARRFEDAARVLELAIPEAEGQRHLRELARLWAAKIVLLCATRATTSARRDAHVQLVRVLEETAAPRITAEVQLELGRLLPEAEVADEPDVLALLLDAADLFAKMPMPVQQSRCLEAAGDLLTARGDTRGAARRYDSALTLLSRRGLGLRAPLLRRKAG